MFQSGFEAIQAPTYLTTLGYYIMTALLHTGTRNFKDHKNKKW